MRLTPDAIRKIKQTLARVLAVELEKPEAEQHKVQYVPLVDLIPLLQTKLDQLLGGQIETAKEDDANREVYVVLSQLTFPKEFEIEEKELPKIGGRSEARQSGDVEIVTLKNGAEVAKTIVNTAMLSIQELNLIVFYELVMKARDSKHKFFGNTAEVLKALSLVQADGNLHDAIRDIVLSASEGEGLGLRLVNPMRSEVREKDKLEVLRFTLKAYQEIGKPVELTWMESGATQKATGVIVGKAADIGNSRVTLSTWAEPLSIASIVDVKLIFRSEVRGSAGWTNENIRQAEQILLSAIPTAVLSDRDGVFSENEEKVWTALKSIPDYIKDGSLASRLGTLMLPPDARIAMDQFLREVEVKSPKIEARSEARGITKQTVRDIEIRGKRVIARVDFNVKVKSGKVADDTRIRAAVPTIQYLLERGATNLVLMSHLGDPEKDVKDAKKKAAEANQSFDESKFRAENASKYDLAPVAARLAELLGQEVKFAASMEQAREVAAMLSTGGILMLPNTRYDKRETSKNAEERETMGKELASFGDVFVNDAFGTAHRAHASTEAVAHYLPAVAVFVMEKELEYLQGKIVDNPEHPFVAVVGGSKVSSKIAVLDSLIGKVDRLIIGGGMAYTFLKAQGFYIGKSLVENDMLDTAREILKKAKAAGTQIYLPVDHKIASKFSADAEARDLNEMDIPEGWMGMDIGTKTIKSFRGALEGAKTVLVNGPVGVFEFPNFSKGTEAVFSSIAEMKAKGAITVVGGGDSVTAVNKFGLAAKMSHVSTGGGASLELVEGKTLPGVAALMDKPVAGEESAAVTPSRSESRSIPASESLKSLTVGERQQLAQAVAELLPSTVLTRLQHQMPEFGTKSLADIVGGIVVSAEGKPTASEIASVLTTLVTLETGELNWEKFLAKTRVILSNPVMAVSDTAGATIIVLTEVPKDRELADLVVQLGTNTGQIVPYVIAGATDAEQEMFLAKIKAAQQARDRNEIPIGNRLDVTFTALSKVSNAVTAIATALANQNPEAFDGGAHVAVLVPEGMAENLVDLTPGTLIESQKVHKTHVAVRNLLAMKASQMGVAVNNMGAVALLNKQIGDNVIQRVQSHFGIDGDKLGALAKLWSDMITAKATAIAA